MNEIKLNIFEKIFEIMEEYENLINNKKNTKENCKNYFFEKDFFNFIYNNINISQQDINFLNNDINNLCIINNNDINDDINNDINDDINDEMNAKYNDEINDKINDEINAKYNENDLIIKNYIKKMYKKIVLLCHPDKNGNKELFIKCQEYYNNNFLIGILYIGYKVKINFSVLNKIIIDHIFGEIRIIQEKIKNI